MKSSRAQVLLSITFGMSSPLLEYLDLDPTSPQNTAKLESWSSRAHWSLAWVQSGRDLGPQSNMKAQLPPVSPYEL